MKKELSLLIWEMALFFAGAPAVFVWKYINPDASGPDIR